MRTSRRNYRVLVDRGVILSLGREMRDAGLQGRAFLFVDGALFPRQAHRVQSVLEDSGCPTHVLALPAGESTKSFHVVQKIYEWLSSLRAERQDCIVALGGGVVGDLAGFVAATWLRGVPFVQIPTTLASMVDASLGGKTAINLPQGKNLVGAFHQPALVLSDVDFLDTLPARELAAGWAEAIKHGLILNRELLETFENSASEIASLSGETAVNVIRQSVRIKGEIVSADEFETGQQRILLNYGHTIGHALESVTGYGKYLHGEAVSIGMTVAAWIAVRLGLIEEHLFTRQTGILQRFQLPTSTDKATVEDLIEAARSDKKSRGGEIQWVLLNGLGSATVHRNVPADIVREAVSNVVRAVDRNG